MSDIKTGISDTTTGFEVPMVYRVCYSCGFNEIIDIEAEGTPAKAKYCPDCGHLLQRLAGTEMFHLNFVDKDKAHPANIEFVPELPFRTIKGASPLVPPSDIAFVKSEGSIYTYQNKNLQASVKRYFEKDNMRALRRKLLQSKLVAVDNKPFTRKGVFGVCPGNFIEKVLQFAPISMKEFKNHKISYVNDNNYHLRIRIDETIVEFKPREGFPFFTKMVAKTVFEDFIRQARNLEHSPARMLAFAMSNGFPVHTESSHKDSYSVRVINSC